MSSGAGCSSTGLAQQIEHAAQALVTHGHLDGVRRYPRLPHRATRPSVAAHGDAAHDVIANVLGNLNDQLFAVVFQFNGVQKGGQFTVPESDVQYRSHDLYDHVSDVFFWHSTHLAFLRAAFSLKQLPSSAPATISVISWVIAA